MHALAQEIEEFVKDEGAGDFESLALALFARHYEANAPYRRLAESLGATPATVRNYRDIPAVPAAAFKRFDLSCRAIEECRTVFHSSGTTDTETSRHYMDCDALRLYETSLAEGYRRAIAGPTEIWALMPTPADSLHSSLSHMLGTLGAARWFWNDPAELAEAIRSRRTDDPIALFGTAFYFVGYFDQIETPTRLPQGSIVIETGGYKGRTREVPRDELYRDFTARFGVPPQRCYGEYGMCEMASQFYSAGPAGAFASPHWVRTCAIDSVSGEDVPAGEIGLLRHYDLANFNSALAIQTQDRGVIQPDRGFTLLGRAPDAQVRGCSLTVEELWTTARK